MRRRGSLTALMGVGSPPSSTTAPRRRWLRDEYRALDLYGDNEPVMKLENRIVPNDGLGWHWEVVVMEDCEVIARGVADSEWEARQDALTESLRFMKLRD